MKNFLLLTTILSLAAGPGGAFAQNPGSLDMTFDPGTGIIGGTNPVVKSRSIQSDGKIIVGGRFSAYNGTPRNNIARVNADGSLDTTFDVGSGANSSVGTIAIQSDGKIVIGGWFSSYDGMPTNQVARLNTDGSLDTTFVSGLEVVDKYFVYVYAIAIQTDGKIVIAGEFTQYNGTPRIGIVRVHTDGSLDETFDPGTGIGIGQYVLEAAIQSDGKILIGGAFSSYNGTPSSHIARVNSDGSLDETFSTGSGADNHVYAIAIQSDGKIIIGGRFTSFNGTTRGRVARLNADGSLDTTFDPGAGASNEVRASAIQSDGKIIIGGYFDTYDDTSRNNIARLNPDGSLDGTFDPGTGTNAHVLIIAIQSDWKIIIGGYFSSYNGTSRSRIARLNSEGTVAIDGIASHEYTIFPNPASTSVTIVMPEQLGRSELVLRDALGQEVLRSIMAAGRNEVPLSGLAPGVYAAQVNAPSLREAGSAVQRTQWIVKE